MLIIERDCGKFLLEKLLIHIAVKSLSFHPATNTYCKHGFTSRVINGFAWKYYGLTVLCEQTQIY